MECTIKTVLSSVAEYGKLDVKFRLTTEQLMALKTILNNSKEDYEGNCNTETNFVDVLLAAMKQANIKY